MGSNYLVKEDLVSDFPPNSKRSKEFYELLHCTYPAPDQKRPHRQYELHKQYPCQHQQGSTDFKYNVPKGLHTYFWFFFLLLLLTCWQASAYFVHIFHLLPVWSDSAYQLGEQGKWTKSGCEYGFSMASSVPQFSGLSAILPKDLEPKIKRSDQSERSIVSLEWSDNLHFIIIYSDGPFA